jgi:phosphoglycerol transferase MdoB-like AlkP superfamily enzyme
MLMTCTLYKLSIKGRTSRVLWNCESCNFIVSLNPSNQMSRVKCQIIKPCLSISCEFDVLVVLLVISFSFSIFYLLFILQQSLLKACHYWTNITSVFLLVQHIQQYATERQKSSRYVCIFEFHRTLDILVRSFRDTL